MLYGDFDPGQPWTTLSPPPDMCDSLAFCATISNTTYLKSLHVKLEHARVWLSDVDRI